MAGSLPVHQDYRHLKRTGSLIFRRAFHPRPPLLGVAGKRASGNQGQPVGTNSSRYSVRTSTAPRLETKGQVSLRAQSSVWSA
jgi:hypothetical protein